MTDSTHLCTNCFRFVGTSVLFAAALVVASTAIAQVLIEDEVPKPSVDPTGTKEMPVTGRVLDTQGAPINNAQVVVVASEYARSARPIGVYVDNALPMSIEVIGPVRTDEQGKFEINVPGSRSGIYAGLGIYAAAKGNGCVTQALGQTPKPEPIELTLAAEHMVRGRCIDLKGQPAAGVQVQIVKRGWRPPSGATEFWDPVTTDDKGRFLIRGVGPEKVTLQIDGDQFTPQQQDVKPFTVNSDESVSLSLAPAKRLVGRVRFADTHEPAANARIIIPAAHVGDPRWLETRTDADGRFSVRPFAPGDEFSSAGFSSTGGPKSYVVNVFPPAGATYLVSQTTVPVSYAAAQQVDVQLQRGVLVRGRVTETVTGNPVVGARVQFTARRSHIASSIEPSRLDTAITGADGAFEQPVPAEPGHLLVLGPTRDYIRVETSVQETQTAGGPGRERYYADAVVPVDLKPHAGEQFVEIKLRKGVRLKGRVVGPDDKPVSEFVLFSRQHLVSGYSYNYGSGNFLDCRNGEFEIPGCDPDKTHLVYLYDRANRRGATAELTKRHEREPAVVRLEPCGSAEARLVDADRKPRADYRQQFHCVLTDGAPRRVYLGDRQDYPLEADLIYVFWLDPEAFRGGLKTDGEGRIVFPLLIPDAKYMIHWAPKDISDNAPWPHVVFTVRAGEKKDLGEIVIEGRSR